MRRASLLLAAALACAIPARAEGPLLGAVETVTLENGLKLLLAPDPLARSVDVTMWYEAGSRFDKPGKTGVAHLFEHLMFRGSTRFAAGEHARLVRAEGGTSGAFATNDFIAFYQTLPPDALDLAFRLESDRMTGLSLTQEALDSERQQVAGERARRATPITVGVQRLYAMAFPTSSYGLSVFGREADLAGVTLRDFREFYRARFAPGRAWITVTGNFQRDEAVAMARRHFGSIKAGASGAISPIVEKPQTAERRAVERVSGSVRVLLAGWKAPRRSDPDWAPLSLLATLLTRASDAPIGKAMVVDRPLGLSIQGDVDSRRDASLFYLAVAVAPEADSAEVESALFAELERAARQPQSDAAIERAKRQVEMGAWSSLQTPRDRAQAIGNGQLMGDPRDLERQLERMRACTAADLQRVAARLTTAQRNVVWLLPDPATAPSGGGDVGGQP